MAGGGRRPRRSARGHACRARSARRPQARRCLVVRSRTSRSKAGSTSTFVVGRWRLPPGAPTASRRFHMRAATASASASIWRRPPRRPLATARAIASTACRVGVRRRGLLTPVTACRGGGGRTSLGGVSEGPRTPGPGGASLALVVHGTTTADNTMIEMSGAMVGLIASEGHRDEIEIRRGYKEDIWNPALPPPPPICPRRQRYGVPERLDFEGRVVVPLDEQAVRRALRRMRLQGVESLAVVFLFSFVDPVHERRGRGSAPAEPPRRLPSPSPQVMPS